MFAREKPRTLMRPDQVHLFAEKYFNYMNEIHGDISESTQNKTRNMIDLISRQIGLCTKPTLNCISIPNKINLRFNKKIEGPLTGKEKLEFLMIVEWNIKEILTLKILDDYDRSYRAALICWVSGISPDVSFEWIRH